MQTLWSRVAQGSCRCPQCAAAIRGLSCRTSASATRRIPQYWTSSTLWFSGIFAAAATFDASLKVRRREKWDKAIAEAQQELGQRDHDSRSAEVPAPTRQESSDGILVYEGEIALKELEKNVNSSEGRGWKPQWPTNTGAPLTLNHLPPQSIYAPDAFKHRAENIVWYPRKLEAAMLAMDILQLRFIKMLWTLGWANEAAEAVPAHYANVIMMSPGNRSSLTDLKNWLHDRNGTVEWNNRPQPFPRSTRDVPLCEYHQDEQGQHNQLVKDLNQTLLELFKLAECGILSQAAALAKIFYNLSISSAPPNVDSYNTLLVGLCNLEQYKMCFSVVHALKGSHIRPNEVTIASVLNLYTTVGDVDKFRHYVQLMRGRHGGLMTANPSVKITNAGRKRLVKLSEDRVAQLPYPTPMVFGALIKGVLKFSGFDAAMTICDAMAQEGWGLCITGLGPLLHDCAHRGDWSSGLAVWKQIQLLKWQSEKLRDDTWTEEKIGISVFASMLRLCRQCNQRKVFENVMDQATRMHPDATSNIISLMKAEGLQRHTRHPVNLFPRTRKFTTSSTLLNDEPIELTTDAQPNGFQSQDTDYSLSVFTDPANVPSSKLDERSAESQTVEHFSADSIVDGS